MSNHQNVPPEPDHAKSTIRESPEGAFLLVAVNLPPSTAVEWIVIPPPAFVEPDGTRRAILYPSWGEAWRAAEPEAYRRWLADHPD